MSTHRPINPTPEGETTKRAPVVEIAPNKGATGILIAIKTNEWGIPSLCANPAEWKGRLLTMDNAQANKLVARYLISV